MLPVEKSFESNCLCFGLSSAPPVLIVKPQDQKAKVGDDVSMGCVAAGNPVPTLFWMKEGGTGVLLPGTTEGHVVVSREGSLTIAKVNAIRDAGYYTCVAVSASGSALARAEVKVTDSDDRPPPIVQLGPTNQTLTVGNAAEMPCEPDRSGAGRLSVTWLRDGVPLENLGPTRFHIGPDKALTVKGKRFFTAEKRGELRRRLNRFFADHSSIFSRPHSFFLPAGPYLIGRIQF